MDVDKLIKDNVGLIRAQIHRLHLQNDPEAESIGYEALYKAIIDFDETRGLKLSTVATCYIYNALGSYIRFLNRKRQLEVVSYNNLTNDTEFIEFFAGTDDVAEEYARRELYKVTEEVFTTTYNKLTNEKQRAIIALWRDSDYERTYVDIAKAMNLSQPYVSQVINTFKFKLKKKLEEFYYD